MDFNYFIYVLNVVLNFGSADQLKKNFTFISSLWKNKNYFKLHKIICLIKWHFCHYPGIRSVTISLCTLLGYSLDHRGIYTWNNIVKIRAYFGTFLPVYLVRECTFFVFTFVIVILLLKLIIQTVKTEPKEKK